MATQVGICNLALGRIGSRKPLASLEENRPEAQQCAAIWDTVVETALGSAWWTFATGRAVLAQSATETERPGWEYVYALPSDCVQVRGLWAGVRTPAPHMRTPFAVEANDAGDGKVLLTDDAEAQLTYTRRLTTVPLYPPLFTDALAWMLASELALSLPVKPDLSRNAFQRAELALARAAAAALREGQEDAPPESELISVRG